MRFFAVLFFSLGLLGIAAGAHADNLITNPNFTSSNQSFPGYTTSTENQISGWSGTGQYGATGYFDFGFWNNGAAPAGVDEVGFIQGDGTLSTTLDNLTVGQLYELNFLYNARSYVGDNCCDATPYLSASVDGTELLNGAAIASVGGSNPFNSFSGRFVADNISEVLTFASTTNGQDGAALLSSVSAIAVTPEPSSLMLLGTGLITGAGALRRRFGGGRS